MVENSHFFISPGSETFLPRDMLCKRGRCRHAASVCPSVRPSVRLSRSYILSKRINMSSNFFSPSSSHILVFPYQTSWRYSDEDRLTGLYHIGQNHIGHNHIGHTKRLYRLKRISKRFEFEFKQSSIAFVLHRQ